MDRFFIMAVHLMDKFERWTKIIIIRWTSGRIFDHGPSTSRTIEITTWWTVVDEWTDRRMKQTDGWMDDSPVSYLCYNYFREDYTPVYTQCATP